MPWSNQGGGGPWGGGGSGGGPGPWGRGPSGPPQPNLEDLLRRVQDQLRRLLPGGGGNTRTIIFLFAAAIVVWLLTGFYRVEPEEQGIALIFGKWVAQTGPGLNYNLPAPIGHVETPKVTRVNSVEIGYRSTGRPDIPQESLMLTGDENIIDIHFVVFWVIRDPGLFLFNVRNAGNPDGTGTVKDVAEASMREIIGQGNFEFARTQGRVQIETDTKKLIQQILDNYGAGILVTEVQLQKVDPPQGAINAFRDVQAARADKDSAMNVAQGYLNEVTQKAQGQAEQIVKAADAYKAEVVNSATGDAQRFLLVYSQYLQNKDVTTRRIYLDTMEKILGGMDKMLIEKAGGSGVVPYLPLDELMKRKPAQPAQQEQKGAQQ